MKFRTAPVGVLADVTLGKMLQPRQKFTSDQLLPYLRAAHIQPNGRLALSVEPKEMWFSANEAAVLDLRRGDVLVVEGGAVGRSTYLNEDLQGVGFQNSLVRLRPTSSSDGRFIDYALRSALHSGAIDAECSTVSMAHFTAEKVSRFRIPLPPLEEQLRIADFLDRETAEIDAMDAELDHLIETLRERRTTVRHEFLNRVGAPKVGVRLLASMRTGSTPRGDAAGNFGDSGELGWVTPEDLADPVRPSRWLTPQGARQVFMLPANSVLVCGIGATIGKVGFASAPLSTNQQITGLLPGPRIESRFLYHAMVDASEQVSSLSAGNTLPIINNVRLGMVQIPLPPLEEQRRIVAELDEQTARIDEMIADANRLKELLAERRSTLITEVVTGVKEVPA